MTGKVLPLGLPLAIGFVAQLAISFTDAALVTRLGARELAGVTLALSVFSMTMLFGLGIVTAATPKLAAAHRSRDTGAVRTWYVQGAWLAVLVGLLGTAVLWQTRDILTLLGQSPSSARIAQRYNTGAAVGLPFFLLYVNARGLLTGVGRPKPVTWVMLAAVPVNLGLGCLLTFGAGPVPGLGVFGAGLASTLVRALVVVAVTAVLLGGGFRELALRGARLVPRPAMLLDLARVGVWIGARILLGEGFLPVLAFFVARFGADATTAHAIGLRLESLVVVFALGFSGAATTVAAWARADGDWRALRDLRSSLLLIGLVYSLGLSAVILASSGFTGRVVFGLHEPKAEGMLHKLVFLVVAYFVVDTLITMSMGYLVGLSDTRLPTLVVAAGYWVVGLGTGVLLSELTPLDFYGLWLGVITGGCVIAVFVFARTGQHIASLANSTTEEAPE
ncbi:MATE family efflux transporter [Actinacidiphila sp. ITFR-21]|uniref:MATE family efflux transporter n=1 Tax=Actinacidiphila sp. ITFR-21 TaxID=3075199 RepID=UPI00288AA1B1|nr:MATE family efflux transporter [Streptomyces sp. ITFR-21]WNI18663.1 MATE family efflux transporter [Streptomyces sp. ITFR-21]